MSAVLADYPYRQLVRCEDGPHEHPVGLLIDADYGLPDDEYIALSRILDAHGSAVLFARTKAGLGMATLQMLELMKIKASKADGGRHLN